MIKLDLPNCSRIYNFLTSDEGLDEEENIDIEDVINAFSIYNPGSIELISPLRELEINFLRQENFYKSNIEIRSEDGKCFNKKSKSLRENLEKRGYRFIPSSKNMTGYIVRSYKGEQVPIATIGSTEEGLSRLIGYGVGGSRTPLLDGVQSFRKETYRLHDYSEAFLETIYNQSVFSKVLEGELPKIRLKYPSF